MLATRFAMTIRNSAGAVGRVRLVSSHSSTINSHIPKPSTHMTTSKFSTSRSRLATKQPNKDDSSKQSESPPPMQFSLDGLGMSRNTKIAVIIILSIFGTMESIFYIRWIWRWLAGTKDEEPESKA
ncbi:hypothetical protein F4677DRAFT_57021 [Hypoxylon crocopeplum]|nr:hypothetical protein F4677DRAFT_57021 [Hypoxylon crocopeplum]